jgi:hypothetical protein
MSDVNGTPKDAKAQAKADKAYKKASRPWFMKKRFWLIGIIVIGIAASALGGGGGSSSSSDSSSETSQEATATPPVQVTAEQLLTELEGNALAAKNSWDGKRVTITGTLNNIDASGDYFTLRGNNEYSFINVQVYIDDSFVDAVSAFKKGQTVTVTGEITGVGEIMGYSVDAQSIP